MSDDGETATLVWSITGPTTYGAMTINAATGAWLLRTTTDLAATPGAQRGRYRHPTYTATVTDANGATDTQTVTITITAPKTRR